MRTEKNYLKDSNANILSNSLIMMQVNIKQRNNAEGKN